MKKIYQNFDGLDISFRCALPNYLLRQLAEAKLEAQGARRDIIARIGPNQIQVAVGETGSRGGFTFRFSTGVDGATWFVVDSPKVDGWNVRVSCNSLMLALYGYEETKRKILSTLIDDLDATNEAGETLTGVPLERISRFDYCFDFVSENFELNPKNFIGHSRTIKTYFEKRPELEVLCVEQGGKIQTINLGKLPNRQVTVYNKRKEIITHHKNYWWKIWNLDKKGFKGEIWRVEVRAGKKELDKWGLKRFRDFETKCGDVIIHTLKNYKYVTPNENDTNRARWPLAEFWEICIKSTNEILAEYICGADRKEVISDYIANIRERYKKHFAGMMISCAAVMDMDISEIPAVFDLIEEHMVKEIKTNRSKVDAKFQKAKDRFNFINNQNEQD